MTAPRRSRLAAPRPGEELSAFRETVIVHLGDPAAQEAARRFGGVIGSFALAYGDARGADWPGIEALMRAAARDLRFLQGSLLEAERRSLDAGPEPGARELARLAGKLATRVGGIARTLEEGVEGGGVELSR